MTPDQVNTCVFYVCCYLVLYNGLAMHDALLDSNRYRFMRAFENLIVAWLFGLCAAALVVEGYK